ncbi:hypothetical protein QYE76_009926 [Lolium multiflorum]|uniref:Uncharacterized protein n=1 Tax=Lolium multiflorum TaxID=4521 RepID=A0AAD8X456_LOLMU|nr:hypothetical protein QYE76_009926 [Lolium multiflorum]
MRSNARALRRTLKPSTMRMWTMSRRRRHTRNNSRPWHHSRLVVPAAKNYFVPLSWVPPFGPDTYYQAGPVKDLSKDEDDLGYEPMESKLTEEEAIQRAMAASEAEERAKWIGLEETIQRSQ